MEPAGWNESLPHLVQTKSWSHQVHTQICWQILSFLPSNYVVNQLCLPSLCTIAWMPAGVFLLGSQLGPGLAPYRAARGSFLSMDIKPHYCPIQNTLGLLIPLRGKPDSPYSLHSAVWSTPHPYPTVLLPAPPRVPILLFSATLEPPLGPSTEPVPTPGASYLLFPPPESC